MILAVPGACAAISIGKKKEVRSSGRPSARCQAWHAQRIIKKNDDEKMLDCEVLVVRCCSFHQSTYQRYASVVFSATAAQDRHDV